MPKNTIIETMQALGYSSNKQGVCYGIAHTAVEATLDNRLDQYLKVSNFIQNNDIDQIKSLCQYTQYIAQHNNEKVIEAIDLFPDDELLLKQSAEEQTALLIKPYFDSISLYFGDKALDKTDEDVKQNLLSQITGQNYLQTQALFADDEKHYPQTIDIAWFDAKTLRKYITDVVEHSANKQSLAMTLACDDHMVFVGYYADQWYFINHDIMQKEEALTDELMQNIINSMHSLDDDAQGKSLIEVQSYARNKCHQIQSLLSYESADWRDSYCSNNNRLAMAMQNGQIEIIDKTLSLYLNFIERTINMGLAERKDIDMLHGRASGIPVLYYVLCRGELLSADKYISSILNSQLPEDWKVELLLAKTDKGLPVLYPILQRGNHDAIALYVSHILNSSLSNRAKETLLIANINLGEENISSINANMAVGQMEGIKRYVTLIAQTDRLLPDEKQRVLVGTLSSIQENKSGMVYWQNKLDDFVSNIIDNDQVLELLLSYDKLEQFIYSPCLRKAIEGFVNASKLDKQVYSILKQDPLVLGNTANLYKQKVKPESKSVRIALLNDLKHVIATHEISGELKCQTIQYIMSELKINHKNHNATGSTACFDYLAQYISEDGTLQNIEATKKAIIFEIDRAQAKTFGMAHRLKSIYHSAFEQYASYSNGQNYNK